MNKEEQLARWWADNLGDAIAAGDDYSCVIFQEGMANRNPWRSWAEYTNDKNVVGRALEWVEEQDYFRLKTPTVVPQEQIADAISRTKEFAWKIPAKMLLELASVCGFKYKYEPKGWNL